VGFGVMGLTEDGSRDSVGDRDPAGSDPVGAWVSVSGQ
jgi:hypothetical protein